MPRDPRSALPALPAMPRLPLAARLAGRPGGGLIDRLERRRVARRLPFALGSGRTLARRRGRLMVVETDPEATGRSCARANFDLVVDACEEARVDYFLVPEPNAIAAHVGVPSSQWSVFVAALRSADAGPVYAELKVRTRNGTGRHGVLVSDPRLAGPSQDAFGVFRPMTTAVGGPVLGPEWACRVSRWDDSGSALRAPERNDRASSVSASLARPVTVEALGRPVRTLRPFTTRQIFEPDFPVDVVYLWVDGGDPEWQARKAAALASLGDSEGAASSESDATVDARFRDGGELRYSLRSLARYAPWVRRIFLVTDGQVPSWLQTGHPRLAVVNHRELFGGAGVLPTFNSHAIGARLHHIEGLSEQYLYLNDDVFFGRDVTTSAFFEADGTAKIFLSRTSLGYSDAGERETHESARRNVANLIERDFGVTPTNIFWHAPVPQRRSLLAELEERYPVEFTLTWSNQFRAHTDVEVNSWLHGYYGYVTGRTVRGTIGYTYIQLGDAKTERQLRDLARSRDREVFCINDHADASADEHARAVEWLAAYFPVPSPYEKPS